MRAFGLEKINMVQNMRFVFESTFRRLLEKEDSSSFCTMF